MPVLTAIDVLGIQSYIFASNRLRDVIGASHLVEWATSRDGGLRLMIANIPIPEVIVGAGGNAILRFDTMDTAKRFSLHYSRHLLEAAPGLGVAIAHQPYDSGNIARGLLDLQVRLAKAKLSRRPHTPQLGLSVMQPCAITGLPASVESANDEWVSSRIAKVRENETIDKAVQRWQLFLPAKVCDRNACFPNVLDEMGRTRGDISLVGVVHVDGNGIGKRIQRWLTSKLDDSSIADEALSGEYRRWSEALTNLGKAVLRALIDRLIGRIELKGEGYWVQGQPSPPRQLDFELRTDPDRTIRLPLRPILLGGDDLTFVCDGRIALDLATTALRAFEEESASNPDLKLLGDEPFTACAGVALVKAHAPFRHSYRLCEVLCASAKRAKREAESSGGSNNRSWIDWHVGTIRPDESVADLRTRQYELDQGRKLTCRPYPLVGDYSRRLTWEWLDRELLGELAQDGSNRYSFRNSGSWGERRNKAKALAGLVVDGGDAVRQQLEAWNGVTDIGLPSPIDTDGFKGAVTPLLDAVELLDIHLRLETSESSPQVEPETAEVNA